VKNSYCRHLRFLGIEARQRAQGNIVIPWMVDQVQHFDVCSVVNNRQTGAMRLEVRMSNGNVSNVNMESPKVEGLCFPLFSPHAEPGYTNACKSRLGPDEYVMARLLRPEKNDGEYMTARAAHAPYQCIDSRTGEPFTHIKDADVVQAYQVQDTFINHFLCVNRFMLMARLAQYWLMNLYSRILDQRLSTVRNMNTHGVDLITGCETRMDWRFVTDEESKFPNLFGNGQPSRGSCAFNIQDGKIKRNQWGGTCISTIGQFSSFVTGVGSDPTGLGWWAWLRVAGGGEQTCIVTAYQPCGLQKGTTGQTAWDQHTRYFEARGEVWDPRTMFKSDLLSFLWECNSAGDEVLLFGDFNENLYSGSLATRLAGEELRMVELCHRTTGVPLPPTHTHGQVPIDGVFSTSGILCTAITLLPSLMGVGDHRVFILDIDSASLLGEMFPLVVPISRRLLNCSSNRIKQGYITLLNQLSSRHLLFKKLLLIDRDSDRLSPADLHLRLKKVDLELEQFMKSAEQGCHKYKCSTIEWSPHAKVWIRC
jgi:hypothetical protein